MRIPFAKVAVDAKFIFRGAMCRKADRFRFVVLEGEYVGSTWYLCHDEEFPEVEINEDEQK